MDCLNVPRVGLQALVRSVADTRQMSESQRATYNQCVVPAVVHLLEVVAEGSPHCLVQLAVESLMDRYAKFDPDGAKKNTV